MYINEPKQQFRRSILYITIIEYSSCPFAHTPYIQYRAKGVYINDIKRAVQALQLVYHDYENETDHEIGDILGPGIRV